MPATARQGTSADPYFGPPTSSDRSASRSRDAERDRAWRAGQAGEPFPWPDREDPELADLYDSGRDSPPSSPTPGRGAGGRPASPRSVGRPPRLARRARASANDAAGVLLGFLGYVLFLNYLRAGPAGVTQWFRAKFLNEVGS